MACRYTYKGKTYSVSEFDDVLRALPPTEAAKFMPGVESVPSAPFVGRTEAWLSLSLKRMIRYAAENGYDRIAWTNGEQQAERYDLSKHVRSIEWEQSRDGWRGVHIDVRDGNPVEFRVNPDGALTGFGHERTGTQFDGRRLADVVGKDVANKIMAESKGTLAGNGLKIGGEGMHAFYDKIVPNVANDVLKKLGGGRVGETKFNAYDDASLQAAHDDMVARGRGTGASQIGVQPGFDITPAMREKAMGGQPLFKRGPETPGGITHDDFRGALTEAFGDKAADSLLSKGVIEPVASQDGLPSHIVPFVREGDKVFGFYDPKTDRTYAVLENLSKDMVRGLAMHEVGVHYGFERMLGSDAYAQVMKRLDAMAKTGNKDVLEARENATREAADPSQVPEETLAYLIQNRPEMGVVQRVIAAVKAFVFRELGIGGDHLTADDMAALARGAVMRAAKAEPEAAGALAPSFARAATDILPQDFARAAAVLKSGLSQEARQREIFRGGFRAAMATLDRYTGSVDAALKQSRAMVDSIPVPERWKAMHEFQTGGVGAITDTRLRPFFSAWKENVDKRTARIQQWGEGYLKETLPNYFSQAWKDPKGAAEWYMRLMSKGPLEGGKAFLKKRTYANYQEGMSWKVFHDDGGVDYFPTEREAKAAARAGDTVKPPLEPLSQNFVDVAQLSLQQMDKFIAMHEVRRWLDSRGWVKSVKQGEAMPDGYAKVDDPAFRTRATFPIVDAEGKPGAASIAYDYAVPELIAKDINNYLDPGLYRFGLWKSFRYAQNLLLSARLGLSAFHAGFTTVDTLVSHVDAGARYMLMGEPGKAAKMLAKAVVSPIESPREGTKYLKQFYGEQAADPDTAAVLHFLTQGGARGRMDPTDFNNSWVKLKRAWADGDLKGTAAQAFPAAIEGVMRPIMHYLVPAQKMTARVLLAKLELDRVAEQLGQKRGDYAKIVNAMGEDAMRQIAYKVVQQVDDRLGQVAYANLFWNKFAKDVAQASIQSVGWNVGTMNVIFGGLGDARRLFKPEQLIAPLDKAGKIGDAAMGRITGRLSYLIALNATVGMAGASLQYLMTGEWPEGLRDYFFPKTGRKNPDGTDERISLPSYVKDEYALTQHPFTTIGHKLHPAFSMVSELLHNEDFYGNQIVNPDDPWTKVAGQIATYLGKSALPYSIQNVKQNQSRGASLGMTLAPFIGVTPAPAAVSRSPFESYVADAYRNSYHKSLTPEEQDKAQARRDALDAIRKGEEPDLTPFNSRERASIYHASKTPIQEQRFARLSLQQKMTAFARATPEERDNFKLRALMQKDFNAHGKDLSDDERERVQDLLSSE